MSPCCLVGDGKELGMEDKNITIGRVINLTGMIGVSAGIVLCWLSELYCSYFGVALASMLETSFTGFGSWRTRALRASAMRPGVASGSQIQRA